MVNLIYKDNLTKDELKRIDDYFFGKHLDELLTVDNNVIIKFINKTEKEFGVCFTKTDLHSSLYSLVFDYKLFFEEEFIPKYKKVLELMNYLGIEDPGLSYILADHYYYKNNNDETLKYYENIFKKGFNLCSEGYIDSLCRYLKLTDNVVEKLEELILNSAKTDYDIEFIDTYLLLINHLDKADALYLVYIDEAIKKAEPLVRKVQKEYAEDLILSDSDIERDYCELFSLKMEYYTINKNYRETYEMYKLLTDEIRLSGCVRYYHIRDLFYNQMLKDMSVKYPECNFFEDISNQIFKVIGNPDALKENLEIVLENQMGQTFNFLVMSIHKEVIIAIAPLLPELGIGGTIFTTLMFDNGQMYLKNNK